MLEDLDLNSIADDRARELVRQLLNLLEDVMGDLRVAQAETQRLREDRDTIRISQNTPGPQFGTPTNLPPTPDVLDPGSEDSPNSRS